MSSIPALQARCWMCDSLVMAFESDRDILSARFIYTFRCCVEGRCARIELDADEVRGAFEEPPLIFAPQAEDIDEDEDLDAIFPSDEDDLDEDFARTPPSLAEQRAAVPVGIIAPVEGVDWKAEPFSSEMVVTGIDWGTGDVTLTAAHLVGSATTPDFLRAEALRVEVDALVKSGLYTERDILKAIAERPGTAEDVVAELRAGERMRRMAREVGVREDARAMASIAALAGPTPDRGFLADFVKLDGRVPKSYEEKLLDKPVHFRGRILMGEWTEEPPEYAAAWTAPPKSDRDRELRRPEGPDDHEAHAVLEYTKRERPRRFGK